MQVMISFIDRKTNLLVCNTFFDISKIKDLDLSPRQIYNYIWENAKPYEIKGEKNDYRIHLFSQSNHNQEYQEFDGISIIKSSEISTNIASVINLHEYRMRKLAS
ncbi:hypothetical protein ABF87_00140 [Nitrosomonas sp. JL21]|uniref:hypothetical protein n=1 Tax=Nitrosomonas sp. JL21 TaxID=153949 RepID=UPI0013688440|nr:hypothetical protein [Nitrosomonas sp. JL21]MBL8498102.1 hypothetical protein [Nitrosomonas sp.]MXS76384.1 hypothetical protein [Nitrosomonas sp. JL21]